MEDKALQNYNLTTACGHTSRFSMHLTRVKY
jgi:hypothetical protein